MPKNKQPLTSKQELFIRMSAQARPRKEILKAVFDIDMDTAAPNVIHAADQRMSIWRKRPEFETVWKDEIKNVLIACTGEAVQVIREQMRSRDIPWLQNKAANDILSYGKQQIYGDEDRTVHVEIGGLPELGTPEE